MCYMQLLPAQSKGIAVALANKKPLTGSLEDFDRLTENRKLIRFESTVGAGLPVIVTLRRLLDSGDKIDKIEGQLSGTLGYILSGLQKGGKFSEIVSKAKELGFTEPDPRDDLSGLDVARKALILSRCFGERITLDDIPVEPLFPKEMAELDVESFMSKLGELDESIGTRVKFAMDQGKRLRYAAIIEPGSATVGLVQADGSSALASLDGTDNLIAFNTTWYNTSPLVVRGFGAGTEVTAAGVLGDTIDLLSR